MFLKSLFSLIKKSLFILKQRGFKVFLIYLLKYLAFGRSYFRFKAFSKEDYVLWIKKNEDWNKEKVQEKINNFKLKPKISIITPVYNVDPKWLDKCIESVLSQFYPNFELCLWDDASNSKETLDCLKKWQEKGNEKIKIGFSKVNEHIAGASNQALKMAKGEFVVLLDNDDEISPNALYECVLALNKNPDLDFIYSDEDKLDLQEERTDPFFKPDFSPDLMLSMFYISHLGFYRKSIVDSIGGFRKGFEGSQDYDLALRFLEKTDPKKIQHIAKILYHWRKLETSTAGDLSSKNYVISSSIKALADYLKRNQIEGVVEEGLSPGRFRIKRAILEKTKVSIIIPFCDKVEVLKQCLKSILEKTDYENYEILLVNNNSQEEKTGKYLKSLEKNPNIRILNYDKPFNFSAINNFAVTKTEAEYVLFLNNDTEVINKEWLSSMVEHIQREEVGVVGAKLLFPNGTVQHAGIILGIKEAFGHAFKYFSAENEGYMSQLNVLKNYSAVTGACLLTKRDLFQKIGGFDAENLKIAFNDVDYCLKLREKGFLVVYTPYANLYHHESFSRTDKINSAEINFMQHKWGKVIQNDPYYNVNLTKRKEDFSLNNFLISKCLKH